MAKLYFYYGAMGSSKSANALMAEYNYRERGQKVLLAKTNTDTRDGKNVIRSRIGLERECILLSDICAMSDEEIKEYDAVIVDEIQFAPAKQIDFLAHIVDDLGIPVLCYGLRTDFQLNLFEGSERLLGSCLVPMMTILLYAANTSWKENSVLMIPVIKTGSDDAWIFLFFR